MSNRRAPRSDRGRNWISEYPELVAQWHPARNGALRSEDLSYGSGRRVWWKCAEGPDHEWEASPNNRTSGRSGCPFCAGRAASVTNSLARYPELVGQWHPVKNGDLKPERVVAGSSRPAWWRCLESPEHQWRATPHDRIAGKGACPFCLGMRVARRSSLAAVAMEVAAEWHPAKNGGLTPWEVTPTTTRVVWWKCSRNPAHEWRASILKRGSGATCPACAAEDARRREDAPETVRAPRAYVLCLDCDADRRLALILFLRSRDIEVLGARDAVEARLHVTRHGEPRVIVTADEQGNMAETFPGVPQRVVPAEALRAWLSAPAGSEESRPAILKEVEAFVLGETRRAPK
jgi:hypothetical protein